MEESKYYTPSIEEFHVGFAYEFKSKNGWVKNNIENSNVDFIFQLNMFKDLENYRVKYLDREDIENLGWIKQDHSFWQPFQCFKLKKLLLYKGFIINKIGDDDMGNPNHTHVFIENINGSKCLFNGDIKNRSELKKLMQQLNIIE